MRPALLAAALVLVAGPAWAAQATCKDYVNASDERDRSLFDGYILGYLSAKLEGFSQERINIATTKVRDMTNEYCIRKPGDPVSGAVAVFSEVMVRAMKKAAQ